MSDIDLNSKVIARHDLLASNLSETELVMMDIDKGRYYGLENVAKSIWEHLKEPMQVEILVSTLAEEYGVDKSEIESDIVPFLESLQKEGLVEVNQH